MRNNAFALGASLCLACFPVAQVRAEESVGRIQLSHARYLRFFSSSGNGRLLPESR
jgi:hypothetical protein